jgi:hypothetical protein
MMPWVINFLETRNPAGYLCVGPDVTRGVTERILCVVWLAEPVGAHHVPDIGMSPSTLPVGVGDKQGSGKLLLLEGLGVPES